MTGGRVKRFLVQDTTSNVPYANADQYFSGTGAHEMRLFSEK